MTISTKWIWRSLALLFAVGIIVACVVMAHHQPDAVECRHLQINITDAEEHPYITQADIITLLRNADLYPIGRRGNDLQIDATEQCVRQFDPIRTAECYQTKKGDVVITLTQRQPLLRVITPTDSYFIDTDRQRLAIRPNTNPKVLIVSGRVSEKRAKTDIYDFADYINSDEFWRSRIVRMDILPEQGVVLQEAGKDPAIVLGSLKGHKTKLRRVRTFMDESGKMDLPQYKELDVRFKGQVIGRK